MNEAKGNYYFLTSLSWFVAIFFILTPMLILILGLSLNYASALIGSQAARDWIWNVQ